jgi:putative SOS response-associated peptidase YedK
MCGRFALHAHPDVLALQFGLAQPPEFEARYNIAPGAEILVVRGAAGAAPRATRLRWGLVPRWARSPSDAARLNNARAESVAQKPSFRDAYRLRRCLVPASGFYEWKAEQGSKQPFYVRPTREELFGFAALWERWEGEGGPLETCAIVTTQANETMRAVHDRMPVILAPRDYACWLDCRSGGGVDALLHPCAPGDIALRRVSRAVNDARNESAALIEPA